METQQILAAVAGGWGIVLGLAPLLQLVRVLRLRHSDQVSLGWLLILTVGTALWLAYGASIGDLPLMIANAAGVSASAATLAVVLHYRRAPGPPVAE